MSGVFLLDREGSPRAVTRVRCANEELELQECLARNLDLLPGDQISPEDPRRWILIQREMPVPDPLTGENRWSLDFLLADQDARPTLVECKRVADIRSRREVVAQMIDYAANGYRSWGADQLREAAERNARAQGCTLLQGLNALIPGFDGDVEGYFGSVQDNLESGQMRLVFYMEEARPELLNIVEFLNRQMERTEVLLVEARTYRQDDLALVVPRLFGYSEDARRVKKVASFSKAVRKYEWDLDLFIADVGRRVGDSAVGGIRSVHQIALERGWLERWGTSETGGLMLEPATLPGIRLITIWSDGWIELGIAKVSDAVQQERIRGLCHQLLRTLGFASEEKAFSQQYPRISPDRWVSQVEVLLDCFRAFVVALNDFSSVGENL